MTDTTLPPGEVQSEDLFAEHDRVPADADVAIRQGDVIQFLNPKKDFPHDRGGTLGFVVTANCDLAYGKNWNLITYVPAIPVETYIQQFVIPKELDTQRLAAERAIRKFFRDASNSDQVDRAFEMIRLGYTPEDVARLLPHQSKTRDELATSIRVLLTLEKTIAELSLCAHHQPFCRCIQAHCRRMDKAKPSKKSSDQMLRSSLRDRLQRFPGDFLYVHKPSPYHPAGYVALLRLVSSIHESSVSLRPMDETASTEARRVARLSTLFCHRVVQQMAQVFTDIGLPTDYELARDNHLSKIAEDWEC